MASQIIINSLIAGAVYALVALGFGLSFRVCNFFNFTHGIIFTFGAYFTFLFSNWFGIPISFFLAVISCTTLGCIMEISIYSPLKKRNSSPLILMLASLGTYIFFQNIISIAFGDETRSIRTTTVQEGLCFLGARITPIQIVTICVSIVLIIALSVFLKKSKIGKVMRAVANDSVLANVSGINSNHVFLWTFAIGSALAGLAGVLVALDVNMTPTMGMNALMMGIVAMIIGGVNSIPGIVFAALLLAMSQHFGAWFIGSQWQDAIAFIILVLFLLFKPEGFFGKKVRSATV